MTPPQTPPPGSLAAIERDCSCAVHHFGDYEIVEPDWKCPLHSIARLHPRENGEGERPASPVRLAGDAWGIA